ncbi:hypothetical protein CEXT_495911 [Caerostris extrusa]|uniref:Ycf1 n=1 Tax=Caerostris extrusa TaxID=172846 RepID=A0AAV4MSK5_CAEEX|nr:hypothetical protein CEXT_495911 [Caerostris extrusa]
MGGNIPQGKKKNFSSTRNFTTFSEEKKENQKKKMVGIDRYMLGKRKNAFETKQRRVARWKEELFSSTRNFTTFSEEKKENQKRKWLGIDRYMLGKSEECIRNKTATCSSLEVAWFWVE